MDGFTAVGLTAVAGMVILIVVVLWGKNPTDPPILRVQARR